MTASRLWGEALAAWAVPDEILAAAPESPYGFPVDLFERSARDRTGDDTPSHRRAAGALARGGSVLDVGCGAGASSLPLVPPAGRIVGVDESPAMLEALARVAQDSGIDIEAISGRWPDVEASVPAADVAVCHHVAYNVGDVEPFLRALDAHARSRVVVEVTAEHPLAWMNPLWRDLHGIERPSRPTADDLLAVCEELGFDVGAERWEAPSRIGHSHPESVAAFTRRRLCLGADREADVREALARHPPPETRRVVTIWWNPRTGA